MLVERLSGGQRDERAAGPALRGRACRTVLSERPDVVRLRALGALGGGELHLLVLIQRAVATRVDCRVVHEDVCRAVVRGDKTVPLVGVEPLYGSLSHLLSPSRDELVTRAVARVSCWLPA